MIPLPTHEALHELRELLQRKSSEYLAAVRVADKAADELVEADDRKADIDEAANVFQTTAAKLQDKIHGAFTTVGNQAIAAVFPRPYKLHLRFGVKRGRTDVQIVLERDGMELDPMTGVGGGVVDLCAFALRLSALKISQPPKRQLLVLDEPFRFVSENRREAVADLLRHLAHEHGVQMVVVTHHPELQAIGEVVDIEELTD